MKSVCRSGMNSSWAWVPDFQPLPKMPPEPMAMVDWMMWKPLPSGSFSGSKSVRMRLPLVVVQQVPGQRRRGDGGDGHADHDLPRQAGEEDHVETGRQYQDRGAEVRLARDEADRQQQKYRGDGIVAQARHGFALLEEPGQQQRHGDLHQFRGLRAHEAEVEPASRALGDVAEQRHGDQQQHAGDIDRHRQVHQALRRNLRQDAHHHQGDGDVDQLRVDPLGRGAGHDADRQQQQQSGDQQQGAVERVDQLAPPFAQGCHADAGIHSRSPSTASSSVGAGALGFLPSR
jgi:hypothetical protein